MVSVDLNGIFCGWQVFGAWLVLMGVGFEGMTGFRVLIRFVAKLLACRHFFQYWAWFAAPVSRQARNDEILAWDSA